MEYKSHFTGSAVLVSMFTAWGCAVSRDQGPGSTTALNIVGPSCGVQLVADANGDCCVDQGDLDLVRANWGRIGPGIGKAQGDLNGDGVVNEVDDQLIHCSWMVGPGCHHES